MSLISPIQRFSHFISCHPSRMVVFFFAVPILTGAFLLTLPIATQTGEPCRFIDAFFTATSAVCVTGLIVKDTPVFFSTFGQGVILVLIQVGGLGIMIMSSLILAFGTDAIRLKQRYNIQSLLDQESYEEVLDAIRQIFWGSILIEAVGALLLSIRFYSDTSSIYTAIWWGVFHSISAYCNAGFALFSDNMIHYQHDPLVNLVLPILIITGGLGFPIIGPLLRRVVPKDIHTRLTIFVTAILLLIGTLFILLNEFSSTAMIETSLIDKVRIAFFQSTTARTAGFNTIDLNLFSPATNLLIILLMFIGGSPGGTAGGIKTTTVGVLFLAARSFFKSSEDVEFGNRRIPSTVLLKAIAIFLTSSAIVTFFSMCLLVTETGSWESIIFESFSAYGTVGLSMGLTPNLTDIGRILVSALMFIGRVGPLTIVALVGDNPVRPFYRHPTGRIMVG